MPINVAPSKLITLKVQDFAYSFVKSRMGGIVSRKSRETIRRYKLMLTNDPICRYCAEITYLVMFSMMGDYVHSKKKITNDIKLSIQNCNGSWRNIVKKINTALWYGYSWTELSTIKNNFNRLVIKELFTLDPELFDFVGSLGEIDTVRLYQAGRITDIPYTKGLHVVIGDEFNFDPLYGAGRCQVVDPYHELHQILLPVLAVAAQRQATPILVKKTDFTNDVVVVNELGEIEYNADGTAKTIPAAYDAVKQLSEVSGSGVTAIDLNDDLFQIEPKIADTFLMELVKYVESQKMLGFLVPTLIGNTSISGLGDSSLGSEHTDIFEALIRSTLEFFCETLVEDLFKPLIIFNHGEQKDYGSIPIKPKDQSNSEMVSKMILEAYQSGYFNRHDLEAMNTFRTILGLTDVDENYFIHTFEPDEPEIDDECDDDESDDDKCNDECNDE